MAGKQAAAVEGFSGRRGDAAGLDGQVRIDETFEDEDSDGMEAQLAGEHQADWPGAADDDVVLHAQ